jgi:hypothetical protein
LYNQDVLRCHVAEIGEGGAVESKNAALPSLSHGENRGSSPLGARSAWPATCFGIGTLESGQIPPMAYLAPVRRGFLWVIAKYP